MRTSSWETINLDPSESQDDDVKHKKQLYEAWKCDAYGVKTQQKFQMLEK